MRSVFELGVRNEELGVRILTKTKTKGFSPLGKTGKEAKAKKMNNKQ